MAFLAVAVAVLAFRFKFKFGLPPVINFLFSITDFFSKITAFSFSSDLIINIIPFFTAAVLPLLMVFTVFKSVKSKFKIPATLNYFLTI